MDLQRTVKVLFVDLSHCNKRCVCSVFCKQVRCWKVVILAKHRPEKGATYLQSNSVNVFAALVSKGLDYA